MINSIGSWAEQIIVAVIIGTILEMVLPKGNTQKYIKTLIGVYILYTIISPVITFATGENLKIDYNEYEKYLNVSEVENNINVGTIEDTFKREIRNQMKKNIEEKRI